MSLTLNCPCPLYLDKKTVNSHTRTLMGGNVEAYSSKLKSLFSVFIVFSRIALFEWLKKKEFP